MLKDSSFQFIKFSIVGGFSAIVNITIRILFNNIFNFNISIFLAFFTALTTAFILNRYFVFDKSIYKSWIKEYLYFFLVNIAGLLQTVIVTFFLLYYIFPRFHFDIIYPKETIAHSIGVIIPLFTSFMGHKYLSFKSK